MKLEKNERTPYIMKTTKHFNDVSRGGGCSAFFCRFLFGGTLRTGCTPARSIAPGSSLGL